MAGKQKILIVDDDENIAELISLYLTKECYECRAVHNGEDALKEAAKFEPNLILLDLMLPGMDGYQVCREIRSTSNTPIIMMSAKGEVFDKVQCPCVILSRRARSRVSSHFRLLRAYGPCRRTS